MLPPQPRHSPAVTVLKPLRGDDGHLYDNLRSFCEQDYPHFELLFGLRNRHDPAAAIVRDGKATSLSPDRVGS